MGRFLRGIRVSVTSVDAGWWYAYLLIFLAQMVSWVALVAIDEAVYGEHTRAAAYIRAVGRGSSHMVQMFALNAISTVEAGRLIMVLAQGIADKLRERRDKFRAGLIAEGVSVGRAEGRMEGRAEGRAEARAEIAAEIADWNRRRLEAEARGEKFDEPPPMV